jgi:hypothetical protein
MGDDIGSAIMAAAEAPKPERKVYTGSVFDTQPFEPEFNAKEAERLSRRAYAEKKAEQPRRTQYVQATPADQLERTAGQAIADTAIGLLQGAAGIPKGIAANINAGDNPIARFYDEAIQAGERSKSPYLQSQKAQREALLKNVLDNQGELAQTRAAFTSMFSPAGADVVTQGAGSMLPTVGMSLLSLGQRSFVAMNALANAGDAAQNTAQELAQMSPQDWSKSDAYQDLRSAGLSHRDAVKMLAPLMAMPSQLVGGGAGAVSGATGLEKSLAGKGIKGGVRERAARAGAELAGEELETLAPSLAGNITQRLIDEKKSITEGLGREAVETAFGSTPGMALAASGRSAPKELDTRGLADRMARERGFLVPETRTERPAPAERPAATPARVEPTFDEEAFIPPTPKATDNLPQQRAQEQADVLALEQAAPEVKPSPKPEAVAEEMAAPAVVTPSEDVGSPLKQRYDKLSSRRGAMQTAVRDSVITDAEYSKYLNQLSQAREAYEAENAATVELTPLQEEASFIADKLEEAGFAGVARGMRSNIKRNVFKTPESLDFYRDKLQEAAQVKEQARTEGIAEDYSLSRYYNEEDSRTTSPTFLADYRARAPQKVRMLTDEAESLMQQLATRINAAGFKVNDISVITGKDLMPYKSMLSQLAGGASGVVGREVGVRKKYKNSNPESFKKAQESLRRDIETARTLLEEETPPLDYEALSAQKAPDSLEVEELMKKQRLAAGDIDTLSRRLAGTSLIKVLEGSLNNSEISELIGVGASRKIGKNPFASLMAKKGTRGSSIEDVITSGKLDPFLPFKMRSDHPDHDDAEAAQYIREKLLAGEFYTDDIRTEIENIQRGIWEIDKEIEQELTLEDINREIQYAVDEQRELDQEAAPAPADGAPEAPESRVGEEEELLKTQTKEELKAKQDEIDRLSKENERLSREAERKAKADEEAGDFVLTGSERDADKAAARGQTDIFTEEPGEAVDENDTGFIGASDKEVADVAKEFQGAVKRQEYDQVTRVFDAPEKGEIVRTENKTREAIKDDGYMTVKQAKQRIEEWKKNAQSQSGSRANSEKVVLSLFDTTGEWSKPWEEAGYQVYRFDIQDDPEFGDVNKFSSEFFNDLFGAFEGQDVYAILAACPCTDFAVSGARHFAAKDADGRTVESVNLVKQTLATVEYFKPSVWAIENPVGRIEKLTGLPPWRLSFNPNHFGDPYTKKTLLWGRFNADLPIAPVEPTEGSKMHRMYGGKSQATKNARSVTPEGFAYAFFEANNAIDNPIMAVANKYDMLDRDAVEAAVDAGMTDQQIADVVDDPYYMDLDYDAASAALQEAAASGQQTLQSVKQPKTGPGTPAFKKWFGDSKVVDENGEPLVVYHGTSAIFNTFQMRNAELGRGAYFTNDPEWASEFGPNIFNSYLSIQNPLRLTGPYGDEVDQYGNSFDPDNIPSGHDGIIHQQSENSGLEIVAFRPEQIKSATGNVGTYDPSNPDIRYQKEVVRGYNISAEDQRIEKELTGKSMIQVADWTVANAPNAFAKVIAEKVRDRLREFQRKGMTLDFAIKGGDTRPMMLGTARGVTQFEWGKDNQGSKITVTLNGAAVMDNQNGYPPGVQYNTILHELLHVATRSQFVFMPNTDPLRKQMLDLFNTVVGRFNDDAKAGNLPPVMEKYYKRMNNVLEDPDELLAWGLTDKDVQTYLDDIKVGEKSIFTKLVELIRKALGLGKPYESALERLVRTSESMLDMDVDAIDAMLGAKDKQIGTKKKPSGPMVQESLFQREGGGGGRSLGKNILGRKPLANWTMPDATNLDAFIYKIQNKQIDMKDAVDAIKEQVGEIDERFDPYMKETLFAGRTSTQTKRFLQNELMPLFEEMRREKVSMPELEEYLHNRHAQERNEQIAKVNPGMPDKGSGIATKDAQDYLANLSPEQEAKYKKLASMVDAIGAGTRQLLVDSGLESQDTIDAWESTYDNYIPLNRDDVDYSSNHGMGVGQGYSVRGPASRRAVGSERKVVDILANIAMQRERNIVRAEKNRVAMALYGMAIQNPNPDFFLAVNPDAKKDIPAATQELIDMGFLPSDIKGLMNEPSTMEIDPQTGLAVERIHQMKRGADNVMGLRVNGENRYVFFNQNNERAKRMATALKNLDADQLGMIMSAMANATRFLAAMNTQYNPIFGAYNFLRDVSTAGLQLTNTPLAGKQAEVLKPKNVWGAMRGIYTDLRAERGGKAGESEWSKLWEEFQQRGGQTGFRDQFSSTAKRGEALQRIIDPSSWADSGLGKVFTAGGALKVPVEVARKAAAPIFNWLSDYNETMENAIRLSAYKTALDSGMSKDAAAVLAKELTVNFNRKGQVATQAGALYAFFNASVQGTTALARTIAGPAGKKIIAGGLMLGGIQAVLYSMAGFDEGEPPEFVREKNFVIPIGNGKYVAIPLPLGYNVIPNTARLLTQDVIRAVQGKKVKPTETVFKIFESLLSAFNPIGNAGWSFQTFAPTLADPFVALGENRDYTGKKIAREDFNSLDPTPGFTRYKESSTAFSRGLAEFMNSMSGGTKDAPGKFSPTPDQIDYLIGQIFGGVGREAMKIERTVRSQITGEELPPSAIPLAGRFYGDTKGSSAVSNAFYENLRDMNVHENTVKGMRKRKENVQEYYRENPEARMFEEAGRVEREIQTLRKRRRELVEKKAPKESVRAIEERITARMKRFNDKVRQREEKKK